MFFSVVMGCKRKKQRGRKKELDAFPAENTLEADKKKKLIRFSIRYITFGISFYDPVLRDNWPNEN